MSGRQQQQQPFVRPPPLILRQAPIISASASYANTLLPLLHQPTVPLVETFDDVKGLEFDTANPDDYESLTPLSSSSARLSKTYSYQSSSSSRSYSYSSSSSLTSCSSSSSSSTGRHRHRSGRGRKRRDHRSHHKSSERRPTRGDHRHGGNRDHHVDGDGVRRKRIRGEKHPRDGRRGSYDGENGRRGGGGGHHRNREKDTRHRRDGDDRGRMTIMQPHSAKPGHEMFVAESSDNNANTNKWGYRGGGHHGGDANGSIRSAGVGHQQHQHSIQFQQAVSNNTRQFTSNVGTTGSMVSSSSSSGMLSYFMSSGGDSNINNNTTSSSTATTPNVVTHIERIVTPCGELIAAQNAKQTVIPRAYASMLTAAFQDHNNSNEVKKTEMFKADKMVVDDDDDDDDAYDLSAKDESDHIGADAEPMFTFTSDNHADDADDDDMSMYQLRADSEGQSTVGHSEGNNDDDEDFARFGDDDMGLDSSRTSPDRTENQQSSPVHVVDELPIRIHREEQDDEVAETELSRIAALFGPKNILQKKQPMAAATPVTSSSLLQHVGSSASTGIGITVVVPTPAPSTSINTTLVNDDNDDSAVVDDQNNSSTTEGVVDKNGDDVGAANTVLSNGKELKVLGKHQLRRKVFHSLMKDNPMWWCWWDEKGPRPSVPDPLGFWYRHLQPTVEGLVLSHTMWSSPQPFRDALLSSLRHNNNINIAAGRGNGAGDISSPSSSLSTQDDVSLNGRGGSGSSSSIVAMRSQTGLLVSLSSHHPQVTFPSSGGGGNTPSPQQAATIITFGAAVSFYRGHGYEGGDERVVESHRRAITQLTPSTQHLLSELSQWQYQHHHHRPVSTPPPPQHHQYMVSSTDNHGEDTSTTAAQWQQQQCGSTTFLDDRYGSFPLYTGPLKMTPPMAISWLSTELGGGSGGSTTGDSTPSTIISAPIGNEDVHQHHPIEGEASSSSINIAGGYQNSPQNIPPPPPSLSSSSLQFIPILELAEGRNFLKPLTPSSPFSSKSSGNSSKVRSLSFLCDAEGEGSDEDDDDDYDSSPFFFSSPLEAERAKQQQQRTEPSSSSQSQSSLASSPSPIIAWIGGSVGDPPLVHHHQSNTTTTNGSCNSSTIIPYLIDEGAFTGRMRHLGTYKKHEGVVVGDASLSSLCPDTSTSTTSSSTLSYRPLPLDESAVCSLHHHDQPPHQVGIEHHSHHCCFPFMMPGGNSRVVSRGGRRDGGSRKGNPLPPPPQYHLHFGRVLRKKERDEVEVTTAAAAAADIHYSADTHHHIISNVRDNEVAVMPLSPLEVVSLLRSHESRHHGITTTTADTKSGINSIGISIDSIVKIRGGDVVGVPQLPPVFAIRREDIYGVVDGGF